jgi:LuxR family maltose regulon positive regulatory protein
LEFANQALENLPENNWIRGYCSAFLGSNYWEAGNLQAALDAYFESYSLGKASEHIMVTVSAAGNIARLQELGGHLHKSAQTLKESFQLADDNGYTLPVAGYIHIDLGRLLYELNKLDAAAQHINEGIRLCQQFADVRAEIIGYCHLSRVQIAQGKFVEARDSILKAERANPSGSISFTLRGGEFPNVRLWLKEKKLKELEAWIHESDINLDRIPHVRTKFTYTMHPRVLIALGRECPDSTYLNDALKLLEELLDMAEKYGWWYKAIEVQALKAMAFQAQGDIDQAIISLEKALTLAEPEGFIRTFVNEGPPMAKLLYEAMDHGISPDYVSSLLTAFSDRKPEQITTVKTQVPNTNLIEPLSGREIEVLQLIADGLTNKEIADRMFLSLNTIKAHNRNIYGKLNVHNRTQAVTRGKALGILDPTDAP